MRVEVREVLPHEYAAAGYVTSTAWHEYVARYPDSDWPRFLADVADVGRRVAEGAVVLGAFEAESPRGTLTLEFGRQRAGTYVIPAEDAYVGLLGVAPDARRRGIGRALMQEAMEVARRHGRQALVLTYDPRDVAPKALYDELGFVDTGERASGGREVVARLELVR